MGIGFHLRKVVRDVLPQSTRDRIKIVLRRNRHLRNRLWARIKGNLVTVKTIHDDLEALGVKKGDVVIIHSSLSRLGILENGAATVIAAVRHLVGPQGTVVVPTLHLHINAAKYLATDPVFDVRTSPSAMGAISEFLRTLPGARRSLHPTHSAAAIGKLADYLTEDHHKGEVPFGPLSPYYRLAEIGGKSIMLGTQLMNLMSCRVIEDIMGDDFPYPVYLPEPVQARVRDWSGREFRVKTKIHNVEMSRLRRNNDLAPYFVDNGIMKSGRVGQGRALVVDAAGVNTVLEDLMRQNITVYTPDGVVIDSLLKKHQKSKTP